MNHLDLFRTVSSNSIVGLVIDFFWSLFFDRYSGWLGRAINLAVILIALLFMLLWAYFRFAAKN